MSLAKRGSARARGVEQPGLPRLRKLIGVHGIWDT
jgi:hypothetical protein